MDWQGPEMLVRLRRGVMTGVVRGTERLHRMAVDLILTTPKTGRLYRRRGVVHQASAPGQPPASDTGRLVQSGRTEYDQKDLTGRVIFSTEYAEHLEIGTVKMEPRPFLRPALAATKDDIVEDIQREVEKAIKS